jgi:hypothetical protein
MASTAREENAYTLGVQAGLWGYPLVHRVKAFPQTLLLGRIRDLEAEWTQDAVEWITTENATLKQRVRQLSTDNRTLDERLTAPRSGLRFQDGRIADLEARLNEQCKTYLSANSQSETSENRSIFVRASADGHIP